MPFFFPQEKFFFPGERSTRLIGNMELLDNFKLFLPMTPPSQAILTKVNCDPIKPSSKRGLETVLTDLVDRFHT